MRDTRWRILVSVIAAVILLSACASTDTVIGEADLLAENEVAATATPAAPTAEGEAASESDLGTPRVEAAAIPPEALEEPDLAPRGLGVVQDAPEVAPPAYSTIGQAAGLGFYYAAADGEMDLIAFDIQTLKPKYQVPASPLGRIRGRGQEIVVDPSQSLVFVTGYDEAVGGEDGGYLAGHDAATWAELWRTSVDYYSDQPFDCGSTVCVRSLNDERRFDKASGALVDFSRVTDRRVFHTSAELTITSRLSLRTGEFVGISAFADYGTDLYWELDADTFATAAGHEVEPGFGWGVEVIADDNVVIMYLSRADSTGWAVAGIDSRTSEILWSRDGLAPCLDTPLEARPAIVCSTTDDPYLPTAIERIDARTGDPLWKLDGFDDGGVEVIYDGTMLTMWTFAADTTTKNFVIDLDTGGQTPGPSTALCGFQTPWVDFTYPDGDVLEFASALTFSMCSSDGYLLYPDEVIQLAPSIGLEPDKPIWLVDFDGAPIIAVG